jgi:murein DD-endopeptidase MepM/ murein hydrolase activator NlpD
MSIRVPSTTLRTTVAIAALFAVASSLEGCSTLGMGSDDTTTGSVRYQGSSNLNQSMPGQIGPETKVAEGPYLPPEDIGSDGSSPAPSSYGGQVFAPVSSASAPSSVSSQDLPVIGDNSSNGNSSAMPAQSAPQSFRTASLPPSAPPAAILSMPPARNMAVVPNANVYMHTIRSGESLYTIARHYGVTAQSIMDASGLDAPDRIAVGQRVVIPGRLDLLAAMDEPKAPADGARLPLDSSRPQVVAEAPQPMLAPPLPGESASSVDKHVPFAGRVLTTAPAPALSPQAATLVRPGSRPFVTPPAASTPAAPTVVANVSPPMAKMPLQEPPVTGADKFRWPLTGKVVVSFAASNDTGINIAAPLGTPVRAVENGTVIYVGSGVEGYGNLILIRHANGYVSAYANLKDMTVAKGSVVGRGDTIGSTGTSGSVGSPQLHFELRKGATPVDPVPLLAG